MDALLIRVRGVVQGVGFRPFVYRLAAAHRLCGWVLNEESGVEIHVEGSAADLAAFLRGLQSEAPPSALVRSCEVSASEPLALDDFVIRYSRRSHLPTVAISPDLPVCEQCLAELFDPAEPRYLYPYINCTNCGPRFSVIQRLPYDRPNTTMRPWEMDALCERQYHDPRDRRFHAQPIACPACGPHYRFETPDGRVIAPAESIQTAAEWLSRGRILAIKGIGGYHLSCNARNSQAVLALRERKFRKEKPFAVMVRSMERARELATLSPACEELLLSPARPIVLAGAQLDLPGVAPDHHELGIMLPYSPLHHLLFEAGAPEVLVMTSANRSSEPIAYRDDDARLALNGMADAFLIGERPIARRVDDSVVRTGNLGPVILRRARGYAPSAVVELPVRSPVLALGADLKNTITLVVAGQAFVSQHLGDLNHYGALEAFRETIRDLMDMYAIAAEDLTLVHDLHPQYASTLHALELTAGAKVAVQHHRAHIASVMAEHEAWDRRAVGISFDGTGYGDDGTIWGGEFFIGGMREGWRRALHLRTALMPGGDAAARFPVQCAAAFLSQLASQTDFLTPPFCFPRRYLAARELIARQVRTFETSSMGRLFDAVAALLGFTREIAFEGQAAIWLEQRARASLPVAAYPFPLDGGTLDFRPLLAHVVRDRAHGRDVSEIARAFHAAVAGALWNNASMLCESAATNVVALSGGVFQNELLLAEVRARAGESRLEIWMNRAVPPNDGGISLGQAAVAAVSVGNSPGMGVSG